MQNFWDLVLPNCIFIFYAEQVYSNLKLTNVKNKEVKANLNPKP